jgi:hypothetical protein
MGDLSRAQVFDKQNDISRSGVPAKAPFKAAQKKILWWAAAALSPTITELIKNLPQ